MPATLTPKDIPVAVHARLKLADRKHMRGPDSKTIDGREAALAPSRMAPSERLARARALRARLWSDEFRAADIDAAKRAGRPRSWSAHMRSFS